MYREIIKEYINENKEEILNLWEKVVSINSGTYDVEGVNKVCEVFENELKNMGCDTKIYEFEKVGNTLIGTLNPEINKEPILFVGHMDTVFSGKEVEKRPFKIENGKATGPGALDMKIGDVMAIFVAKALEKAGYKERPIKFIFAGDEESAHEDSNCGEIIMKEAKGAKAAITFETGRVDEGIVVGRKGSTTFRISIEGISAHSGNDPEKGRSAILEAAHKVIALENLNDIARGKLVNCGLINGGTSDNTIPGNCSIVVLTRNVNQEIGDEIIRDVEKILNTTYVDGTKTTYEVKAGMGCMERTDGVMELFELVRDTAVSLGFPEPHPVEVGGGSDSSFTVAAGVPTVCAMGAKGEFNHTEKEYAVVDSVFERIELAANVVYRLN
ncbi:glutamate carboxypeptidase [Anaerosphaera aminiphila DSM 21120]|uniref:Glutamate carboxypeptidase n=1 Tax=Anaerosphaera aminiphila DSM 21120 TaxID=1120995 RepID=A0A1M5TII8_9FIRM|nr:M20 family metallopeptidase [Anaerosphaera aminiphila]SHH50481.1 glutamate carboxypeptidase [Anaerosphaera aminiphila DSM 21120]